MTCAGTDLRCKVELAPVVGESSTRREGNEGISECNSVRLDSNDTRESRVEMDSGNML